MTGIIYLGTDRFEVRLEGITFKIKDFESLCASDFLFPKGKIWSQKPVVGIDIMRHPIYHNVMLLLLCIGVGCVILRFRVGESVPIPILKFLTDERIRFVGFALPKRTGVFPYENMGLRGKNVDIRYLAAMHLNDSTYKRFELEDLARKVLGIKRMLALTDSSSFERHEHIKCAICKLFITSAVGNALFSKKDKKKLDSSPKIMLFLKSFNYLPLLGEGWLKLPKVKKDNNSLKYDVPLELPFKETTFVDGINLNVETRVKEGNFVDDIDVNAKIQEWNNGIDVRNGYTIDDIGIVGRKIEPLPVEVGRPIYAFSLSTNGSSSDDSIKDILGNSRRPIKGILKCASMSRVDYNSPLSIYNEPITPNNQLRRANSKGLNVSFALKL